MKHLPLTILLLVIAFAGWGQNVQHIKEKRELRAQLAAYEAAL